MSAFCSVESATPSQATATIELTILMPCLNEIETLPTCIEKASRYLATSGVSGEIVIADNGSTDGSQEAAIRLGARVVPVASRGYGAALLGGIAAARGRYLIMGDADDSYDFSNLQPFLDRMRAGDQVVIGNRFRGGIEPGAMPFLHRYLGNPVLSALGRLFFKIPVHDFHCGLRGFETAAVRDLGLITTGMEFASEMIVRSALRRLRMSEVPTTLRPDGRSRAPHLRTWRDGWRHLKFLLMYSPKWLFLFPGGALTLIGLVLALALSLGPMKMPSGTVLDLNAFTAACFAVIAGVQIVSFGLIARHYATQSGMLPRGDRSQRVLRHLETDRVVSLAAILFCAGLLMFATAVVDWYRTGFGDLSLTTIPRVVVGGLTLVVIALQLAFGGFILGILQIPMARAAPAAGARDA